MVLSHPASGLSPLTSFGKKEKKTRFSKREKPPTSRTETSAHILFLVAKREPSLAGSVWYEGKHTSRRHINTRMLIALQHHPMYPTRSPTRAKAHIFLHLAMLEGAIHFGKSPSLLYHPPSPIPPE